MRFLFLILLFVGSLFGQTYRDSLSYFKVNFSEPIRLHDLQIKSNYLLVSSEGDTINLIRLSTDPKSMSIENGDTALISVTLTTKALKWGISYTITVNNVRDRAGNVIDPIHNSWVWSYETDNRKLSKVNVGSRNANQFPLICVNAWAKDTSQVTTLPYRAIDGITYRGDISEIWTSRPIPEWIVVELDQARAVHRIDLSFSYFHDGRIYSYSIDYSMNGSYWYNLIPLAYSVPNKEWVTHQVFISCKYVRINFITNNQSEWAGLYEIKLFGE